MPKPTEIWEVLEFITLWCMGLVLLMVPIIVLTALFALVL